jgi:hypothetical protein
VAARRGGDHVWRGADALRHVRVALGEDRERARNQARQRSREAGQAKPPGAQPRDLLEQQIAALERDVGTRLLERGTRPVKFTDAGTHWSPTPRLCSPASTTPNRSGVINLSPDKKQVFAEAARLIRPGGRLRSPTSSASAG